MQRTWRTHLAALAAIGCTTLALAACGSDDDNSTGSESASASNGGGGTPPELVEEAKKLVAENSELPTEFGITEPLATKPTGKVLDYVACPGALCTKIGQDLTEAGKTLGLKVNIVNGGASPEEVTAAFNKVVQDKPDAVINMNYPIEQWREQLAQLAEQGAKVFVNNVPDKGEEGITAHVFNDKDAETTVQALVRRMTADTDGAAKAVYVNAPDAGPGATFQADLWKKYTKEYCPGCELDMLNVKLTDIGKTVPQTVVSYLQANPDVDYVAFYFGDMMPGVPAALKGAGLSDRVKVSSGGGSKVNWQYIRDGGQWSDRALYLDVYAYQLADLVARATTDQEYEVPLLPTVWVDQETEDFDLEQLPFGSDFKAQFAELWSQAK